MSFVFLIACLVILILLITWVRLNAFLSFLIVSIIAGFLLQLPMSKIIGSIQKGIGDTIGSLVIIICLGAMLGKLVAESGAAQRIASALVKIFGIKYLPWAVMITGFVLGIPLFYGVGFVLLVPLVFSIVYQYKLPAVFIGLPLLAALSVTHGFLPPHPSPTALVQQFHANMGLTLLYGLIAAVPSIILAGPVFGSFLKKIPSQPLETFHPKQIEKQKLPGTAISIFISLLPVLLLILSTLLQYIFIKNPFAEEIISFAGDPSFIMLLCVLIAAYMLGIKNGKTMKEVMIIYGDAVKDIGMILLIIAGAGALKQVITDSGVTSQMTSVFQTWKINPLLLGWVMAAIIRICIGSATIAGLTTAGIIAPLLLQTNVDPNLMVLSIGAGSLMFSHVNDSGFWLFKEYFNLSIKNTFKTWTAMESIVSITGLIAVLVLSVFIK